jgi:malate dehydrogenase (oxaloacetate-decarboxylating)(NADP+)
VLIGHADVISARIGSLGLRLKLGENCEAIDILGDPRCHEAWTEYSRLMRGEGVSRAIAKEEMRSRSTLIGAMLVRRGDADAMLCGTHGIYAEHLRYVRDVIGLRPGVTILAAMNMLMLPGRQIFICDTYVNRDPSAEQIAEMTLLAAEEVRRFGLSPSVALLSHSSFGSSDAPSAQKMREALALVEARAPDLAVDGEMHGDAALSKAILDDVFPGSRLKSEANLLIMPNVDAANIAYNILKVVAGGGITVGAILLGAAKPVHILDPTATTRRIVNMTALAVVDVGSPRPARE